MWLIPLSGPGTVLVERYRLEERLSGPDPLRGSLWRAVDVMAGDLPVAMRQLELPAAKARFNEAWPQLQSLLDPQLPRCRELLEVDGDLWLLRDWQDGVSYDVLLRQKRLGPAEVLVLLRQILPVLELLHGGGLVHGDVNPCHLVRRRSDGLPVLLDGGRLQRQGATEEAEGWGDLQELGHTALMLLSGSASHDGGWPEGLELDLGFRQVLERMLSGAPERRFGEASEVLKALESVVLPGSEPQSGTTIRAKRAMDRQQGSEGRLWPVVIALVAFALIGTTFFSFFESRNDKRWILNPLVMTDSASTNSAINRLPSDDKSLDQLTSRLRVLRVNQSWFTRLVESTFVRKYPDFQGNFSNPSFRDMWINCAEDWLARIEMLSPQIRSRLGSLRESDVNKQYQAYIKRGVNPQIIDALIETSLASFSPKISYFDRESEPFRQYKLAVSISKLNNLNVEFVDFDLLKKARVDFWIPAGEAKLFFLASSKNNDNPLGRLKIKGSPLVKMSVYSNDANILFDLQPVGSDKTMIQEREAYLILLNLGISGNYVRLLDDN